MLPQCKCYSYAIDEDPDKECCDVCYWVNQAVEAYDMAYKYKTALKRLEQRGIHHDCNPTRSGQSDKDWELFLLQHLKSADRFVRELAKEALHND